MTTKLEARPPVEVPLRTRVWTFSVIALAALSLPASALAQHRDEAPPPPGRGVPGRPNEGRPGEPPPPPPPGNGLPRRSPQENDARYQHLQGQPPGKLSGPEREELGQLQARQKRLEDLKAQDAERERNLAERQRQAHEAAAAQLAAQLHNRPPPPAYNEEFSRYAERKATLIRAKQVAIAEGRADAAARCDSLLATEEQRHAAWIAAHPA
jgi:hypothetical protein